MNKKMKNIMKSYCYLPIASLNLAIALTFFSSQLQADVIAYDDFESYGTGSIIGKSGGTGWTGAWGEGSSSNLPNQEGVISGGLTYSNGGITIDGGDYSYQTFGGGAGTDAGVLAQRAFASTSANVVYVSFLIQVSLTDGTLTDDFGAVFLNSTSGVTTGFSTDGTDASSFGRLYNLTDAGNYVSGGTLTLNTTHLIVLKLERNTTESPYLYDQLSLWVDPDSETESVATASTDGTSSGYTAALHTLGFRVGWGLEAEDFVLYDEVRIADSWASAVIPEPSTVSMLLGLGVFSLVLLNRRLARRS